MPARRRADPWTLVLILACAGVTSQTLFFDKDIVEAGAASRHLLWEGDLWRIPAAILLHGGWVHLLVNCLGLFFVGPVITRGVGGPVFYATLFFSAFAGLAASLLFHSPITYLVGISGGVLGLIGLVLAIEWHNARGSWMAFFRARNTKVIIVLILVNAILAVVIERVWTAVQLDHAAHLGGLFFGLFFGLALFGRSGLRPRAATITALLLSIAPLTYAAWPQWDKTHVRHLIARAEMAWQREDPSKARRLCAFALELDPGHPFAGAWLAWFDDDPKIYDQLREPTGNTDKRAAIRTRLDLAERRLDSDLATATRLVQDAARIGLKRERSHRDIRPIYKDWLAFGVAAEGAKRARLALLAYEQAANRAPGLEQWRGARWTLGPLLRLIRTAPAGERFDYAERAARQVRNAISGLAESSSLPPHERPKHELALYKALLALTGLAQISPDLANPPARRREFFVKLTAVWHDLAQNIGSEDDEPHPRRAEAFLHSANAGWRAIQGLVSRKKDLPSVAIRFKTALIEALENEAPDVAEAARAWFSARGLPIPKVAEPPGGG